MPKSTAFDNDLLKLVFNGNNIANLADNGASPITSLFIALHTADPSAGNQNTNEIAYTSYGRVAVARNSSGWTVSGNNAVNAAITTFPTASGGNNTAAWFSVGKNNSGVAGEIYYAGALTNNLTIVNGVTPQFGAGNLQVTES